MANAEMTPAEAGRRGESAIELLEDAEKWLEPLRRHSTLWVRNNAAHVTEKVDQALELLRNAEDDGN